MAESIEWPLGKLALKTRRSSSLQTIVVRQDRTDIIVTALGNSIATAVLPLLAYSVMGPGGSPGVS